MKTGIVPTEHDAQADEWPCAIARACASAVPGDIILLRSQWQVALAEICLAHLGTQSVCLVVKEYVERGQEIAAEEEALGELNGFEPKGWVVTVYNSEETIIGSWTIEDRTERQAAKEAMIDICAMGSDVDDWTLKEIP